jgi:hypothetical protein
MAKITIKGVTYNLRMTLWASEQIENEFGDPKKALTSFRKERKISMVKAMFRILANSGRKSAGLPEDVTGEEIKIKSSTGDVKLTDCDASNLIDIETSTGDVNAVLLSGKTFETKTSTGINDVPPSTEGAPLCRIKTSTGDIKVTVK